jgi:UDP-N-acetylmuramoylalanine--D-glutamate ligase
VLPAGGVYVLELSSYQIDLTHSLACDVAVLLNITPDHLDRYDGDFMAYAASKGRLFTMQHADQVAVIATDDDRCRMIASHINHRLIRVSGTDRLVPVPARWPALQGPHNAQNAACAIAVAGALGVSKSEIMTSLVSYSGLPHRMERVGEIGGVLFVNDSKATNAASVAPALAAYPPAPRLRIHWILGGLAKGEGLGECEAWLGHVAHAYLIGDAAAMFARALGSRVPSSYSGTVEQAVLDAAGAAQSGDVVLLSPACASFDQFRDFEARGDAFRAAVAALPGGER